MSVRQEVVGFTICLVAGMVLSFSAAVVVAIAELPHVLRDDSSDPFSLRRMIFAAVAFATACAIARIFARRRTANGAGVRASRAS